MELVSCKNCGLVHDKEYVRDWDGSVFDSKDRLIRLKCKVCRAYTTIEGE